MNNPLQGKADSISPFQLTPSVFLFCGLADAMQIYSAMSNFVQTSFNFQNNTRISRFVMCARQTSILFLLYCLDSRLHCFNPKVCSYVPCGLGVDLVHLHNNLRHFRTNKEAKNIKPISKQINVLTTMTEVHKWRIIYTPFV